MRVRDTVKPKVLRLLARYVLRKPIEDITDADIMEKVRERTSTLQIGHIPDVQANLRMDMSEKDIDARILKYFVDFEQLVEDHGFETMLGVGSSAEKQDAKIDDVALHGLILQRATAQQHYHLMQLEEKHICGGVHFAQQCPTATDAQKTDAKKRLDEARAKRRKLPGFRSHLDGAGWPDSGADCCLLPEAFLRELQAVDGSVQATKLDHPVRVELAVDLLLGTKAGTVHVRRVNCLILPGTEEEFLIGDDLLKSLGIDVDGMMEQLAGGVPKQEDGDDLDDEPEVGSDESDAVVNSLGTLLLNAERQGFQSSLMPSVRSTVLDYTDRARLGADDPAKVKPYSVKLKPDATPFRTELQKFGLVRLNNANRWACAAVPVRKAGLRDAFRLATDYRPVNRMTVPIAAAVPNLVVVTSRVRGAKAFAKFDLFNGFWQMPSAENSQEIFSIKTDEGVYTPTRVPWGAVDSAMHFQSTMQEGFGDMMNQNLLVYVDDVVLYAPTDEEFLVVLDMFFWQLRECNLKLNVKKSSVYAQAVTWCGKIVDGAGVTHDPARVDALRALPLSTNAGELQHLLCAANWLRESIVEYGRVVAPLQEKFDQVMTGHNRKKRHAVSIEIVWTANLNHTPVLSLGGRAPTELFIGLPCPSPLDTLLLLGQTSLLNELTLLM
ncbi:LOW QUALITY PROTEIN: hypothetical protein PHMEG_00027895 [Phytophthora megakarya]|uniref:Reverse transcriptase domain-containing protein n=1 Tax=Phytophthora megakarya TaxID=4795 RepID=A0A225V663_9STRA|nr:LOW QUALITY PROTEIN: hypothetical protein PHMEG_00027895 [Phytophthora megakarya]